MIEQLLNHLWTNIAWYGPIGALVAYELFSFITRIPSYPGKRLPTLSQLVWWGYDRFAYLPHVVMAIFSLLYYHFFVERPRKPPKDE